MPVRLATYLLNEKKDTIKNIEFRHNVEIKIVPDPDLDTSSYEIDNEGLEESEFKKKLNNQKDNKKNKNSDTADGMIIQDKEVALMSAVKPKTSPPRPSRNYSSSKDKQPGIFSKFFNLLFGNKDEEKQNNKQKKGTTIEIEDTIRTLLYNKYKSNNKKKFSKK